MLCVAGIDARRSVWSGAPSAMAGLVVEAFDARGWKLQDLLHTAYGEHIRTCGDTSAGYHSERGFWSLSPR